jgi:hypothetical protein
MLLIPNVAVVVLMCSTSAAKPPTVAGPSFQRDVIPLLTKLGCNQGACHGKLAGQNGFRLSLRGFAPDQDWASITREFGGRRVDTTDAGSSLFLEKPLGRVSHEGGKLFAEASREHSLLLLWLHHGARKSSPDEPRIRRLRITPDSKTLQIGDQLSMSVTAEFSDGSNQDVTWLTKFDSSDPGIVSVTAGGTARAIRSGQTVIRAAYMTEVAAAVVTVPFAGRLSPERLSVGNNRIDDFVFRKLEALRIEPSAPCDDSTFVRRVFLDVIGLLPSPEETRSFLSDTRADKRSRLIDRLLERPEFADYWAQQLADLFQNRRERDHDVRGVSGVRRFHAWIRHQVAINRPWDELVRDLLTATGKTSDNPAVGYFIVTVGEHREAHQSEVVSSIAQTLLGTRIGCAQCHNHPLERYTQDDYYHFAAFFSRIRLERKEPKDGLTMLRVSHADPSQNRSPVGVSQPRTGRFLAPQPLDRTSPFVAPGDDPRRVLANWITDPGNEYFTGAMVNRLWKHFLNVGLVEPVDDLRATNPPTNPELWRYLCDEFVRSRFDRKHLIRLIVNSRTYQLESNTVAGNENDSRFYSHYYARRLPAEVLLDAISQATGVPDRFPGYPDGIRAMQVADPGLKLYFLTLFGKSDRVTACACERSGEVTMPQLLHLLNSETTNKIRSNDGRLARLLREKLSESEILDTIFLATLARPPASDERAAFRFEMAQTDDRASAWRDLFWAILNSKNFVFNH